MAGGNLSIRLATLEDVDTLASFNCSLAIETEGLTLDLDTVRRGVRRGIENADEVVYYVADIESETVGGLMLTREWTDWRDGWLVWLQSVYVRDRNRGQGVFVALLHHVINVLEQQPDVKGLRLYVERQNSRALGVYAKTGFAESEYRILERPLGAR